MPLNQPSSVGIVGLGKFLPDTVLTNTDIQNSGVDTNHEWIVERTGIHERRIIDPDMATSDMAYEAAKRAIKDAGISPKDIDMIIVATTTPDYPGFPSVACMVQDRLGCNTIAAFDVSAACTGFSYAFITAAQYVQTGMAKRVLVIGADALTKWLNWSDRSTCILFGDGAGAAVVTTVEKGRGILASVLHSNGRYGSILKIPGGGTKTRATFRYPVNKTKKAGSYSELGEGVSHPVDKASGPDANAFIYMEGKAVFKVAIDCVVPCIEEVLAKAGLSVSDIDLLIPHQANVRIIDHVAKKLKLDPKKVFVNIDRYGNTSAASIPIGLTEAVESGRLSPGDIVVTVGFGAGFTWGANVIRWS